VADSTVIAFTTTKFKSDDFIVFKLIDDFGSDMSTVDERGTDFYFAAVGDKKNFGKLNIRADLCVEFLDLDLVAGFHAVLFAAGLYNCVCHKKLDLSRVEYNGGNRNLCKRYVLIF
jgi:hypothetical protein